MCFSTKLSSMAKFYLYCLLPSLWVKTPNGDTILTLPSHKELTHSQCSALMPLVFHLHNPSVRAGEPISNWWCLLCWTLNVLWSVSCLIVLTMPESHHFIWICPALIRDIVWGAGLSSLHLVVSVHTILGAWLSISHGLYLQYLPIMYKCLQITAVCLQGMSI